MTRLYGSKTFLFLLLVCLFAVATPKKQVGSRGVLPPRTQAGAADVAIFADDFEGGNTIRWRLPSSWATVESDGNWYLKGAPNGYADLVTAVVRSDYRLRTDLRIVGGWAGLHYRQGYGTYLLEVMPGWLYLSKHDGQQWLDGVASGNAPISTGIWYTVEISGTAGHIQVLVDSTAYLDYVDSDPIYAGTIGLSVYDNPSAQVDFDNVEILVPDVEQTSWVQTNGPSGGIIQTIEIDPLHPDVLYAAGSGGSVFKSLDGGATWMALEQIVSPSEQIHDILISPANPDAVYALAGRLFGSSNGGQSWSVVNQGLWFSCVSMQRSSPQNLVAGTWEGHVYYSANGGDSWMDISANLPGDRIMDIAVGAGGEFWAGTGNGSDGHLYHTTDGGGFWDQVDIGQRAQTDIHTIFVDPQDSQTVYVGLVDVHNEMFNAQGDNYLLKTEDGGATWTPLHLPGTDAMINVIGRAPDDDTLYVGTGGMIFKSGDGGATWTWIGPGGRNGDMCDIAVDPLDKDVLYLPRRAYGIVKSVDGGANWTPINEGLLNVSVSLLAVPNVSGSGALFVTAVSGEGVFKSAKYGDDWTNVTGGGITHPWADELVIRPQDPKAVWYVADVAEVFETTNSGVTWAKIVNPYGDGFRFGSVYALALAPSDPDIIYALKNGFGIFKSVNGGDSWRFLHQSEVDYTYSMAVHPTDPDTVYSGYNPKPFQDWAMVRQTTDGGLSWRTTLTLPHSSGVTSVAIDPNAPETVYAGSTGQGGHIWVSRDGGDGWTDVNERFNFTNIHALAVDPTDADVAYAGIWGGGTFRTEDGGQSWTRLPNDPTISASAILVQPTDSDMIYLADRTAPRVYRTADGGATWETYFDAGAGYYRVMHAALAPSEPTVVYASIFTHSGPMAGDVFRIESGTGSVVTGDLPRLPVALTVDLWDSDTVYAVLHGYGVYKTTDGGLQWDEISSAGSGLPGTPHIGFNSLTVDPHDRDVLYLAGGCDVDVDFSHSGADAAHMHTVYKSPDGGSTWVNLNDGHLGVESASVKAVSVAPDDASALYLGTANGVFRSTDGGTVWENISAGLAYTHTAGVALNGDGTRLYVPTLGGGVYVGQVNTGTHQVTWEPTSQLTATIYNVQVAVDPSDSQALYASAYPGGTFKSLNGGATWTEANFGMASFEIDDPRRQGYYAFAIAPSDPDVLYLGLYGVGVYKSTDGAGTWQPMNGMQQTMRGLGITALLVDPANASLVYVATEDGVYRTADGGAQWEAMSQQLGCTDIRALAMGQDGRLYAGSRGYELYAYDDSLSQWDQLNAFGNFGTLWPIWNDRPLYQYTSLLFHPTNANLIYIGTFPAGIFKSTDGGMSWRESNVGWTNDGVFSLVFHPENTDIIYAGTYNGVNRSTDGGARWETWAAGWPAEQWVFSIDFDPRDPKVMYACSKNGENEGNGRQGFHGTVMKSLNGGTSWFPVTEGLNVDQEFYKIIVDKHNPDTIYLATQREGVFIGRDGGAQWLPWNDGLTNPVAGTNGNNVTNTMVQSANGLYVYFGSAGSGVFRRMTMVLDHFTYLPLTLRND